MAIQNINVGLAANDGTGDDLREAFIKINQNFQNLDGIAQQTGANLGSSGAEVFSNVTDNTLLFRRLVPGTNIALTQFDNTITIESTASGSSFIISGDTGSILGGDGTNFSIVGADAIAVAADENTKTITIRGSLEQDTTPVLSAQLDANSNSIIGVDNLDAQSIEVTDLTLTNINNFNYQERIGRYVEGFDMGGVANEINSILDFIVDQTGVDLGSLTSPASTDVDLGSIA
jgi:hypothetical protein